MKQVIITGAFVKNKGAQSMLFTVIDEVRKDFPNCNVSVLVNAEPDTQLTRKYNFDFVCSRPKDKLKVAGGVFAASSYLISGKYDEKACEDLKSLVKRADLIIDISGFALSSKFTRNNTINYLSHIKLAKKFNKPIVLFPQSFGPFDYHIKDKWFLMCLIKNLLRYPYKIYAREREGLAHLESFGLKNTKLSIDTVFHKRDSYNLENIYKEIPIIREVKINPNSVAIIPNINTLRNNGEKAYNLYSNSIKTLIELGKQVYLIRHSTEDLVMIEQIYNEFHQWNNVHLIRDEYSSIELHNILSKFDFVIASRYHSIVHSYKVGTPALVLGWATKYEELLLNFDQKKYQFDIENVSVNEFASTLKELADNYENEKKIIGSRLQEINKISIFNDFIRS